MQPNEIFKSQPIVVPAGMVHAIWTYIASKPSVETAWLVVQFQQIIGPQMQSIEDAETAKSKDESANVVEPTETDLQTV